MSVDPVDVALDDARLQGFFEKHFERLCQLTISLGLLVPAWYVVIFLGTSNIHMVLGTNVISIVAGFWIGSSYSNAAKDKLIAAIKETPAA
jgi:hypothetical protein